MMPEEVPESPRSGPRCCCGSHAPADASALTRRDLLQGTTLLGTALGSLGWSAIAASGAAQEAPPARRALVVKPVLVHRISRPAQQTSWRIWGGIQTQEDAEQEAARIRGELEKLASAADFPVRFLPVSLVRDAKGLGGLADLATADTLLIYAAGDYWFGGFQDALAGLGKPAIVFTRFQSGPLYSSYTTVSPCLLRRGSHDRLAVKGLDEEDVVVDSQEELRWRLRALCGLENTIGSRIVAIGGPGGWGIGARAPKQAVDRWKLDIQTVNYPELSELLKGAKSDTATVERARRRADEYLKLPGTTLETGKAFVENAFLLEEVFRGLMKRAECRAITVNSCMGAIMPVSETTACLTLSALNDAGYLAYCESDFVVIPAGILATNICGRPTFLNDPCYPHGGQIALAHCTAPRKMDGRTLEPARLVTHYESDYGAAPKVEMHKGQKVTNLIPDFKAETMTGFVGEIVDAPFLPICRSQIVVRFACESLALAEKMRGYHWITFYGDWLREARYALKKVGIAWERLE